MANRFRERGQVDDRVVGDERARDQSFTHDPHVPAETDRRMVVEGPRDDPGEEGPRFTVH